MFSSTSNRYHSTSFVKTNAPGGFLPSGTAVLTDLLEKSAKKTRYKPKKGMSELSSLTLKEM